MITGSAVSPAIGTLPTGPVTVPGLLAPGGRTEPLLPGHAQAPDLDRIILTSAGRLDLLMTGAQGRLTDLDGVLQQFSGSGTASTPTGTHLTTRLVQVTRAAATAVDTAINATAVAIAAGDVLPRQAERVDAVVAHASTSLRAAGVRLMQARAIIENGPAKDGIAAMPDRDRARATEPGRIADDDGRKGVERPSTGPPDPLMVAAALAAVQEITRRLAGLRPRVPACGSLSASHLSRRREHALPARGGRVRRPVVPVLCCLAVGAALLRRLDPGPVQHLATLLAPLVILAWCGHWFVRRQRDARWQDMLSRQNEGEALSCDASMSDMAAYGVGHAIRTDQQA